MTISEALGAPENQNPEQVGSGQNLESDAADLLRAARLLLDESASLRAIQALHGELSRTVGHGTREAETYVSHTQAEERQRQLWEEFVGSPESAPRSRAQSRARLGRRLVVGGVLLLGLVLAGVYGPDALQRYQWLHQHPDGNWISRYYDNTKFEGPAVLRYDVAINYDFGKGAPANGMPKDRWSARWDTCMVVKNAIELPVRISVDDASKLLVDDAPQIEIARPGRKSATLSLTPGIRHLELDFVERQGTALIHLEGVNFSGTEDYSFQRPNLDGERPSCN